MASRNAGAAAVAALVLVAGGAHAAQGPDLGVTILRADEDARSVIAAGQLATVSVGVHNLRGDAEARGATLTVLIPAGLAVEKARPAPARSEPDPKGTRLAWDLGTVAPGAFPRIFEMDLRAGADVKKGTELVVDASAASADKDAREANNRAAYLLVMEDAVSDLHIASSLDSVPFTPDRPVDFEIDVTNLGTVAAEGCELAMTLPAGAAFVSSDPATEAAAGKPVAWKLGDVAPLQSRKVKVTIRLDAGLATAALGFGGRRGALEFDFAATTATPSLEPSGGRLKISRYPERVGSNVKVSIGLEDLDEPRELPTGKEVTYDILYGNYGNEAARQVSATLNLPEGLRFVSAMPQPAGTAKGERFPGAAISWDLGDLEVGRSGTIQAKVHVDSVGKEEKYVEAIIAAGAGHDVGSSDKRAFAWYGPPLEARPVVLSAAGGAAKAGNPDGGAGGSRWILWLGVAAIVSLVFAVLWIAVRRRRAD